MCARVGGGRRRGREVSTCPQRHAEPVRVVKCVPGVRRFSLGFGERCAGWWGGAWKRAGSGLVAGRLPRARDTSPRCGAAFLFQRGLDGQTARCLMLHMGHTKRTWKWAVRRRGKGSGCVSEAWYFPCAVTRFRSGRCSHRSSTRRAGRAAHAWRAAVGGFTFTRPLRVMHAVDDGWPTGRAAKR